MRLTNEDNMILMGRYPDNHFDLAIVDPPYGININSNIGRRKRDIKKHKNKNWDKFAPGKEYFDNLFRVSKNQIVWGANNFIHLPASNGWIVWDKLLSGDVDFSECELAYSSVKNNVKKFSLRAQSNENYSVKIHPTQKPVKLYEWLLMNYAKEGDKVLDTHLGSGSIAIACHKLKFDLTACELDQEYYEAACKRIKHHRMQLTLF